MPLSSSEPSRESLAGATLLGIHAAALAMFAAILVLTLEGRLTAMDQWARYIVRPGSADWMLLAAAAVSNIGYEYGVLPCGVALFGWLLVSRRHADAAVAAVAQGGSLLANHVIKQAIARPRPELLDPLYHEVSYSFPSGHAMAAATLATLLLLLFPRLRRPAPVSLAGLAVVAIGVSRVALQVHFPSDVIGGWAAGVAWVTGIALIAKHLRVRGAASRYRR
jgi:membrane-associated phospholipid phosphatase